MSSVEICIVNNMVGSRQVAEKFSKRHADVLRLVEEKRVGLDDDFNQRNFASAEYSDRKGETRPEILMTRDGFAFIAMGFTGKEADGWKIKFIQAFNAMEQQLSSTFTLPKTMAEALRLAANLSEENDRLSLEVAKTKEVVSDLCDKHEYISLTKALKELGIKPRKGLEFLRTKKVLGASNLPLSAQMGTDHFSIKSVACPDKVIRQQTLVTGSGLVWLRGLSWPTDCRE